MQIFAARSTFPGRNRISGRLAASQIAAASCESFFWPFTNVRRSFAQVTSFTYSCLCINLLPFNIWPVLWC